MLSAGLVAIGLPLADPIIAIVITGVILLITWQVLADGARTPDSQ